MTTAPRRLIGAAGLSAKGITYSRQHRKALIDEGKFPAPVKGVGKADAWVEDEIDAYIAARIAARDAKRAASPGTDDTDKAASTMPASTGKAMPASTPKVITRKRTAAPKEAQAGWTADR
jgi:prophage regulatory protein